MPVLGAGSALLVDVDASGSVDVATRLARKGRAGNPAAAIRAGSEPALVSICKLLRRLRVFAEPQLPGG
jgi:hypothetical protein